MLALPFSQRFTQIVSHGLAQRLTPAAAYAKYWLQKVLREGSERFSRGWAQGFTTKMFSPRYSGVYASQIYSEGVVCTYAKAVHIYQGIDTRKNSSVH